MTDQQRGPTNIPDTSNIRGRGVDSLSNVTGSGAELTVKFSQRTEMEMQMEMVLMGLVCVGEADETVNDVDVHESRGGGRDGPFGDWDEARAVGSARTVKKGHLISDDSEVRRDCSVGQAAKAPTLTATRCEPSLGSIQEICISWTCRQGRAVAETLPSTPHSQQPP